MAGNTAAIDLRVLKIQWASHQPMAAICSFWSVSKDQLIRLRNVIPLEKRHDRRLRYKPRDNWHEPTDPAELAASEGSLTLAPAVAARATCVSAFWDDRTRAERQVTKPSPFRVQPLHIDDDDVRHFLDDMNRDMQS